MDSQESFNNIVVQVIGEISNKAAAHRKFVQTFVLAEQPKGYFVLNDIFRYIVEDEEEELEHGQAASQEVAPTLAAESEAATLTSSADLVQQEHDAEQVDKKIEVEVLQKPSAADEGSSDVSPANGYAAPDAVEISHAEDVPTAAMDEPEEALAPDQAAEATAVEQATQPEKPQDHDPTAVASPPKSTHATPVEAAAAVAPPKPAAPKTWAHLVAANRVAAPVVPNGASTNKPTSTPAPTAIKAAPSSTNLSATPPTSSSEETSAKNQQPGNAGWQMAGSDNNKKQGRQHAQSVSETHQNVLGYVKNVTDKVDASILKKTLLQYGELVYFDVSRPKVCRCTSKRRSVVSAYS